MRVIIVSILLAVSTSTIAGAQPTASVHITISDIREASGTLIVALFDTERNFLKNYFRVERQPVNDSKQQLVTFEGVPYGIYAISIIHDLNENDQLDKNLIGIPKEAFGFSNNAMGTFGPPKFKAASFKVDQKQVALSMDLVHF